MHPLKVWLSGMIVRNVQYVTCFLHFYFQIICHIGISSKKYLWREFTHFTAPRANSILCIYVYRTVDYLPVLEYTNSYMLKPTFQIKITNAVCPQTWPYLTCTGHCLHVCIDTVNRYINTHTIEERAICQFVVYVCVHERERDRDQERFFAQICVGSGEGGRGVGGRGGGDYTKGRAQFESH